MSRSFLLLLAALMLALIGCSKPSAEPDPTPTSTPADTPKPPLQVAKVLPVAPYPHLPGEREPDLDLDLTRPDPELQKPIESAIPEIGLPDRRVDPILEPPVVIVAPPSLLEIERLGPLDPKGLTGSGSGAGDSFAGRRGATRQKLFKEGGGNEAGERAMARGLAWLAKQQKPNGSWQFDGSSKDELTAATGMAVLAFLGAGETHKGGKYMKTVKAGLEWLISQCPNAGEFKNTGSMYAQGIGTLALVEAYGMTEDKQLRATALAAVNYIQKAQAANGSWGYRAGTNGDTSIVGWQIQALHATRQTPDIKVDEKVLANAVKFLDSTASGAKKSTYGYINSDGAAPGTALTAVGLFCRERIDGWNPKNAGLTEGVEELLKRGKFGNTQPDMYFIHYATLVLREYGGDDWKTWYVGPKADDGTRKGGLRDTLVNLQVQKEGADLGSWDPDSGFIGRQCGRLGTTAMSIIALEAPYR